MTYIFCRILLSNLTDSCIMWNRNKKCTEDKGGCFTMSKYGIVNVKMVITEEKILSNIDKITETDIKAYVDLTDLTDLLYNMTAQQQSGGGTK